MYIFYTFAGFSLWCHWHILPGSKWQHLRACFHIQTLTFSKWDLKPSKTTKSFIPLILIESMKIFCFSSPLNSYHTITAQLLTLSLPIWHPWGRLNFPSARKLWQDVWLKLLMLLFIMLAEKRPSSKKMYATGLANLCLKLFLAGIASAANILWQGKGSDADLWRYIYIYIILNEVI